MGSRGRDPKAGEGGEEEERAGGEGGGRGGRGLEGAGNVRVVGDTYALGVWSKPILLTLFRRFFKAAKAEL